MSATDPWSVVRFARRLRWMVLVDFQTLNNRPGISLQPGNNWSGNSVGTVRVAGTPGYSETTQTDGG